MSFEFSSNFDDFLQPKPPILWIFGYFFTKIYQNDDFLGLKLKSLKYPMIFNKFLDYLSFTWDIPELSIRYNNEIIKENEQYLI